MKGVVFDIQRFALHDGPGIRTTAFLKGCPLSCLWCHNPESQSLKPQLSYDPKRCTHCLACVSTCPHGAHKVRDGKHYLNFVAAARCDGRCVATCMHGALKMIGQEMSVAQVMEEVMRDAAYYRRSGGGLTLSGGEPLAQFEFAHALLQAARAQGLHTCLDTSGLAPRRYFEVVLGEVDLFLYDYKATEPRTHKTLTGAPNRLILDNLNYLYQQGARILLRCPLVPGMNDSPEHLEGIAELSNRYPKLEGVEIMAYHNMGRDKATHIGRENPLANVATTDEVTKAHWIETLHKLGCTRARCG